MIHYILPTNEKNLPGQIQILNLLSFVKKKPETKLREFEEESFERNFISKRIDFRFFQSFPLRNKND